jgi:lipopolysaccharide biosynthesis glycosyltransferase
LDGPDSGLALVFAADEGFARPLAVAMHSALEHLSPRFAPEIYVLDNGISNRSRDRLQRTALTVCGREIRWIRVPSERLVAHHGAKHLTSTSYARLLIPELLPANIRRAVYLDGDLLVKSDVSPLFEVELGDAPFAAVRDFVIGSTSHGSSGVREPVVSRPYFNAGVLAIDVARWRDTGFAERALAYAAAGTRPLLFADQDAMNAVAEKWHQLDLRWNVQVQLLRHIEDMPRTDLTDRLSHERDDLYRGAAVLHFTGSQKPWNPWVAAPGTMLWARALMRSGWYKPAEYLRWVVPWLSKRAVIAAGRRAATYAPRSVGDAGRRAAKWARGRSSRDTGEEQGLVDGDAESDGVRLGVGGLLRRPPRAGRTRRERRSGSSFWSMTYM